MKLTTGLIIGLIGSGLILVFFLIVPVIIYDQSWWWLFAPLIFILLVWIAIGIILLILHFKKKPIIKANIDLKGAEKRAIYEMKYDTANPDNFKIIKPARLERIGEKGTELTPICIIEGLGTEKNERRAIVSNLNNPKQETTKLINYTPEQLERAIKKIAERPPEEDTKEETTLGVDQFGRPITTTRITRPSSTEKKAEEEKKKVEEKNLM
jgi:hypothetical protein